VQIGSTCPKGLGEEEREREREINKTNKRRIHAKNLQMLTGPCYLFEAYCNPITEYLLKVFLLGSCSAKFAETQRHRERERHTHTHTIVDGSDGSYEKKPKKKNFTLLHRIHEGGVKVGPNMGKGGGGFSSNLLESLSLSLSISAKLMIILYPHKLYAWPKNFTSWVVPNFPILHWPCGDIYTSQVCEPSVCVMGFKKSSKVGGS
jgi:hypothetical protein